MQHRLTRGVRDYAPHALVLGAVLLVHGPSLAFDLTGLDDEDLLGDDFDPGREEICRPDEVVLESGRIVVVGCAYPPSGSPRLFLATLESDDGRSFRAGELMAKLVGPVGDALRGSVHRAFRGLRLKDRVGQPGPSVPLYEVLLSSDRNPPDGPPTIGWERLRDLDRWRADRCGARAGHRPA